MLDFIIIYLIKMKKQIVNFTHNFHISVTTKNKENTLEYLFFYIFKKKVLVMLLGALMNLKWHTK